MSLPELQLSPLAFSVGHWLKRGIDEDREQIDFNAPYQRESVWTLDQRRALIKSLLMGVPVGSIVVSVLPYGWTEENFHYRVIDGKQRVLAVRAFHDNEFTIPASWLPEECNYEGDPDGWVTHAEGGRYLNSLLFTSRHLPALEYKGTRAFVGFKMVTDKKTGQPVRTAQWRDVTAEELLAAEAEIFMLINTAGTEQTEETLARAAELAGGS
jgi:hypothetical protein